MHGHGPGPATSDQGGQYNSRDYIYWRHNVAWRYERLAGQQLAVTKAGACRRAGADHQPVTGKQDPYEAGRDCCGIALSKTIDARINSPGSPSNPTRRAYPAHPKTGTGPVAWITEFE